MKRRPIYIGFYLITLLLLLIIQPFLTEARAAETTRPEDTVHAAGNSFRDCLTEAEREYLDAAPVLNVVLSANKGPIQYIARDGSRKGISKDLLEEIAALAGLRLSFTTANQMQEIQELLNSKEAQILSGIPDEETVREVYDVAFSRSYLTCSYGVVLERGGSLSSKNGLTLALTAGLDLPEQFKHIVEVKHYDSIQECIRAVKDKEADFTYGNSYVLEFYTQGYAMQRLCVIPLDGEEQKLCFGVSSKEDKRLVSILNKAIDYLGSDRIMEITVENVAASTQGITLASVISNNPVPSFLFLVLVVLVAVLVIRNYRHKNKLALLEHQRYLMASAAAREYFFEYNCKTDTLVLAPDMAELFGCRNVLHKWKSQSHKYSGQFHMDTEKMNLLYAGAEQEEGKAGIAELQFDTRDKGRRWFRITRTLVRDKGRAAYIVGKMTDIQEEYEEKERLVQKSRSDSLTGLYNAEAMHELVDQYLGKYGQGIFFMIDLDYFKTVNDRYGHQKGDEMLKSFAAVLKKVFRSHDMIGRIGGDEFAVFAKDAAADDFIRRKCVQLQEAVRDITVAKGHVQTISIGVAKPEGQPSYDNLYRKADVALYQVKNRGRDGYCILDSQD